MINDATESRMHLVVNTVGGGGLLDLIGRGRGRSHNTPRGIGGWQAPLVPPQVGRAGKFPCETINVPVVMSPWELNSHFSLLFADAVPHPQLQTVRARALRFARVWQGLWFQFGDRPEGHAQFQALTAFLDEVSGPAQPLLLNNELHWFTALMAIIGKIAISSHAEDGSHDEYGPDDDNATSRPAATSGTMR